MKKQLPTILLTGCAAVLVFGLLQLFKLRFEIGDVYPPYSSLRSDPLGTMALYESLEKLPRLSVQRDMTSANRLPDGRDTTYLHLSAPSDEWREIPRETYLEIEQFVARGGRLVITFFPEFKGGFSPPRPLVNQQTNPPPEGENSVETNPAEQGEVEPPTPRPEPELDDENQVPLISIADRWGIGFEIRDGERTEDGTYDAVIVSNQTELSLPQSIAWHSGIIATNAHAGWQTIYADGTNAVVAERKFGRGSVVFATDSYFLSNEAMLEERHPELLAWLVGSNRTVVFDEAHLGVMETPGMATLLRQYRLHWLIGALVVLAGLFIWKNSVSLVPQPSVDQADDFVSGKDAAAGFVNLLRRSVPMRSLLETCFAEWKKSASSSGNYSTAKQQEVEALFRAELSVPARERDPVRIYTAASSILSRHSIPARPRIPGATDSKPETRNSKSFRDEH